MSTLKEQVARIEKMMEEFLGLMEEQNSFIGRIFDKGWDLKCNSCGQKNQEALYEVWYGCITQKAMYMQQNDVQISYWNCYIF